MASIEQIRHHYLESIGQPHQWLVTSRNGMPVIFNTYSFEEFIPYYLPQEPHRSETLLLKNRQAYALPNTPKIIIIHSCIDIHRQPLLLVQHGQYGFEKLISHHRNSGTELEFILQVIQTATMLTKKYGYFYLTPNMIRASKGPTLLLWFAETEVHNQPLFPCSQENKMAEELLQLLSCKFGQVQPLAQLLRKGSSLTLQQIFKNLSEAHSKKKNSSIFSLSRDPLDFKNKDPKRKNNPIYASKAPHNKTSVYGSAQKVPNKTLEEKDFLSAGKSTSRKKPSNFGNKTFSSSKGFPVKHHNYSKNISKNSSIDDLFKKKTYSNIIPSAQKQFDHNKENCSQFKQSHKYAPSAGLLKLESVNNEDFTFRKQHRMRKGFEQSRIHHKMVGSLKFHDQESQRKFSDSKERQITVKSMRTDIQSSALIPPFLKQVQMVTTEGQEEHLETLPNADSKSCQIKFRQSGNSFSTAPHHLSISSSGRKKLEDIFSSTGSNPSNKNLDRRPKLALCGIRNSLNSKQSSMDSLQFFCRNKGNGRLDVKISKIIEQNNEQLEKMSPYRSPRRFPDGKASFLSQNSNVNPSSELDRDLSNLFQSGKYEKLSQEFSSDFPEMELELNKILYD